MTLPLLSHLQFFVLDLVLSDEHSGRFIRERLAEEGGKQSLPAFYQLMARLEECGFLAGWYESFAVDGQTIKERRYRILPAGKRAHAKVKAFYAPRVTRATRSRNEAF